MTEIALQLQEAKGLLRKISINVLNKDANMTLFTLPLEGFELTEAQLDGLMGQYTFRSWYNQRPDGVWVPMPWWSRLKNGSLEIEDEFFCEGAVLAVAGGQELEFEEYEPEEGDEDDVRPAARITSIVLKPTPGGITLLSFHLQVRPGLGDTNTTLQEHQFRHVQLTLSNTKIAPTKGKQQSMAFEPPADTKAQGDADEESGQQQLSETATAGEQLTPEERAAAGITDETDAALDKQLHRPGRFESRGGAAIDADMAARREQRGPVEGTLSDSPEDLKRFEENAATQVAAFNAKPGEVIDGRSERVKNQDRRRSSREH